MPWPLSFGCQDDSTSCVVGIGRIVVVPVLDVEGSPKATLGQSYILISQIDVAESDGIAGFPWYGHPSGPA